MINSFSNDREVASERAISAKAIVPVIILILTRAAPLAIKMPCCAVALAIIAASALLFL